MRSKRTRAIFGHFGKRLADRFGVPQHEHRAVHSDLVRQIVHEGTALGIVGRPDHYLANVRFRMSPGEKKRRLRAVVVWIRHRSVIATIWPAEGWKRRRAAAAPAQPGGAQ